LTKAGLESCTLDVSGMTCAACSTSVEAVLTGLPGVSSAVVSLMTNTAQIWYQPGLTGPRDFVMAIEDAGFEAGIATAATAQTDTQGDELAKWRRLLLLSSIFTVPVFLLAMVFPMFPSINNALKVHWFGFPANEVLKWGLTTPVQYWVGWRFHIGAYKALKRGVANMDVLVSLGTNASYIYSVISILHHHFAQHHQFAGVYEPTVRSRREGRGGEGQGGREGGREGGTEEE
jgi:Cu+-exporting ATPase